MEETFVLSGNEFKVELCSGINVICGNHMDKVNLMQFKCKVDKSQLSNFVPGVKELNDLKIVLESFKTEPIVFYTNSPLTLEYLNKWSKSKDKYKIKIFFTESRNSIICNENDEDINDILEKVFSNYNLSFNIIDEDFPDEE